MTAHRGRPYKTHAPHSDSRQPFWTSAWDLDVWGAAQTLGQAGAVWGAVMRRESVSRGAPSLPGTLKPGPRGSPVRKPRHTCQARVGSLAHILSLSLHTSLPAPPREA